MLARRRGIPGDTTLKGPLTAFAGTPFDVLLKQVEARPEPPMVDFALFMLEASGRSIKAFNEGVAMITAAARGDLRHHDFSLSLPPAGVSVHTSFDAPERARDRLEAHVEARKYDCRVDRWFGLFVEPGDGTPLVSLILEFPWFEDPIRAELAAALPPQGRMQQLPKTLEAFIRAGQRRTPGRNALCPCGSGQKFKKCCGR